MVSITLLIIFIGLQLIEQEKDRKIDIFFEKFSVNNQILLSDITTGKIIYLENFSDLEQYLVKDLRNINSESLKNFDKDYTIDLLKIFNI